MQSADSSAGEGRSRDSLLGQLVSALLGLVLQEVSWVSSHGRVICAWVLIYKGDLVTKWKEKCDVTHITSGNESHSTWCRTLGEHLRHTGGRRR